jgi:hypothetical protein
VFTSGLHAHVDAKATASGLYAENAPSKTATALGKVNRSVSLSQDPHSVVMRLLTRLSPLPEVVSIAYFVIDES